MLYYYKVCQRKLWYFSHELAVESDNQDVIIGKHLDETTYLNKNKHILIDGVINIDYVEGAHIIHEVKKSKKIQAASELQLKYYLYYLKQRGVTGLTGRIDYPLLRKTLSIELTEQDELEIEQVIDAIRDIKQLKTPPKLKRKSICKACAYQDLCWV